MMKDLHTAEPWVVYAPQPHAQPGYTIKADDGTLTVAVVPIYAHGQSGDNARRITACVNACAGIPTSHMEGANVKALLDALNLAYTALSEDNVFLQSTTAIKMRAALAPFQAGSL